MFQRREGAARQTLSPGDRADPGLSSVRGLDWLGQVNDARGDLRRESASLGQGSRASLLVDLPRDEMALLIELVVHQGMN